MVKYKSLKLLWVSYFKHIFQLAFGGLYILYLINHKLLNDILKIDF
jgi:hypothetical protein